MSRVSSYAAWTKQNSDQKTRIAQMFCGRRLVNLINTFEDVHFFINIIIFHYLELGIALAIPASNE